MSILAVFIILLFFPKIGNCSISPLLYKYEIGLRRSRSNALTIADGNKEGVHVDKEKLIVDAKRYEKYILTGE